MGKPHQGVQGLRNLLSHPQPLRVGKAVSGQLRSPLCRRPGQQPVKQDLEADMTGKEDDDDNASHQPQPLIRAPGDHNMADELCVYPEDIAPSFSS